MKLLQAMMDEKLEMKFLSNAILKSLTREARRMLGRAGCIKCLSGLNLLDRATLFAANKKQNRPVEYQNIVRLCKVHGISSHFSNIRWLSTRYEESIRDHLDILKSIGPSWASFYILCPIPGTEQYDDFLNENLIVERNLDSI